MKPVAWMQRFVNQDGDEKNFSLSWEKIGINDIPLYTAPRELSDDEIEALGREHIDIEWFDEGEYGMEYNMYGLVDFARAILKKASER
jgi:hypothetical protein